MLLSQPLFSRLKVLKWVRQLAKKQLQKAYSREEDLQAPHQFQVRDSFYIRHLHAKNLETLVERPLSCTLDDPTFYLYGTPFDFASAFNYRSMCVK